MLSHVTTVDSKLWAEAVEWLIQHDPPKIHFTGHTVFHRVMVSVPLPLPCSSKSQD